MLLSGGDPMEDIISGDVDFREVFAHQCGVVSVIIALYNRMVYSTVKKNTKTIKNRSNIFGGCLLEVPVN